VIGIVVAGWFVHGKPGQNELDAAIAETDRLDPNWRLVTLEASRLPMPPTGLNGYEQLQAAAAALPSGTWPKLSVPESTLDFKHQARLALALTKSLEDRDRFSPTLLNPEQAKALRSELKRASKCLILAREMVRFPNGRGPSLVPDDDQTMKTDTPDYLPILKVAKALSPDLRVRVFDGDLSGGLQNVSAILHMSAALADEPWQLPQVLRGSLDWLAVENLETLLAGGEVSDQELAQIQKELEAELAATKCLKAIRGERAQLDDLFERFQYQGAAQNPKVMVKDGTLDSISQRLQDAQRQADLPFLRARGLRLMNEYQRLATLPLDRRLGEISEFESRNVDESFDLWPSRSSTALFLKDEIDQGALLNCAVVAVAMERFRLANKRWPETLEQLTPKLLNSIPVDPFDGQPLRLVKRGTARIIYSVGPNGIDEGGKLSSKFGGRRQDSADFGFILHDPAQRRHPAPPLVLSAKQSKEMKHPLAA
jgi:hypothetical protein